MPRQIRGSYIYDVLANADKQADRYLVFEKWWSGFSFMNEAEIRWIVENLFIGNKLTRGEAAASDGKPIDPTRIDTPVVAFVTHGDNITPPQQALNWIFDLYEAVSELKARGHVVIHTLHDSIGHLGIFVSTKVAIKQHKQITSGPSRCWRQGSMKCRLTRRMAFKASP